MRYLSHELLSLNINKQETALTLVPKTSASRLIKNDIFLVILSK